MSRRLGALLLIALTAASCGPDPIEKYLDSVEGTMRVMLRDSVAALPDPTDIDRAGVTAVNEARLAALEDLLQLVPPLEVTEHHEALVDGLGDLTTATTEFLAATADLDAEAFADAVLSATEFDALVDRVSAACDGLQATAIEFELTNTLAC
jgi:hypothetical protein